MLSFLSFAKCFLAFFQQVCFLFLSIFFGRLQFPKCFSNLTKFTRFCNVFQYFNSLLLLCAKREAASSFGSVISCCNVFFVHRYYLAIIHNDFHFTGCHMF